MDQSRVEQFYNLGQYQEAWWAYKALTARGEASGEVCLWAAKAARAMGRPHSALHALEQGMAVAAGDHLGRLRFAHAVVLMQAGRLEAAEASFSEWLADLPQYPALEQVYLGLVYYHLGLLCRQQERFPESMQHYAAACKYLRRDHQREYLSGALHNLAWVACLVGDEATALDALDEALPLCVTPELHWHQQIGRAFWLAVSRRGDLRMAMTLCEEVVSHQGDDLPLAVRSHAYWLAGRVALELDLADTARVMAEQALLTAVGVDTDRCLTDAYRLMAEVDNRFVRE